MQQTDAAAPASVQWYVVIHRAFGGSGVGFARADWIEEKSHQIAKDDHYSSARYCRVGLGHAMMGDTLGRGRHADGYDLRPGLPG